MDWFKLSFGIEIQLMDRELMVLTHLNKPHHFRLNLRVFDNYIWFNRG